MDTSPPHPNSAQTLLWENPQYVSSPFSKSLPQLKQQNSSCFHFLVHLKHVTNEDLTGTWRLGFPASLITCSFAAMTACHSPSKEQVEQQCLLDPELAKYTFSKKVEFLSRDIGNQVEKGGWAVIEGGKRKILTDQ